MHRSLGLDVDPCLLTCTPRTPPPCRIILARSLAACSFPLPLCFPLAPFGACPSLLHLDLGSCPLDRDYPPSPCHQAFWHACVSLSFAFLDCPPCRFRFTPELCRFCLRGPSICLEKFLPILRMSPVGRHATPCSLPLSLCLTLRFVP